MSPLQSLALWIYRQLLTLYPRAFRATFAAEMEAVFAARLADARLRGVPAMLAVCLHESAGLVASLMQEHVGALRKDGRGWQHWLASPLVLALIGSLVLLRRGFASYVCNLSVPDPGIVNQLACRVYHDHPHNALFTLLGVLALLPLLQSIARTGLAAGPRKRGQFLRLALYALLGSCCGVVGQLSPRWVRWLPLPWTVGQLLSLGLVWLLPMLVVALAEARRERGATAAGLAVVALWLTATQAYYLCWAVLLASGWAGAQLETLQLVGTGTRNVATFWAFLRYHIGPLMWNRGTMAIPCGALLGTLVGHLYLWRVVGEPVPVEDPVGGKPG
jgi:hypothetical protein